MKLLVVGGAGYVGSHMVANLLEGGHEVVTLDNLSTGFRDAVLGGTLVEADFGDRTILEQVLAAGRFEAVLHFASSIQVAESVRDPSAYYRNNFANTLNLLDAMVRVGPKRLVFSSTAAVFGEPDYVPIDENHPRRPLNPYGASKQMVEQALADYERAHGMRWVSLRYFNAAGAHPNGRIGERHDPETHLIPLVLRAAAGTRPHVTVYGLDYDTPDGSCIRDYVHVMDLCQAHRLALAWLMDGGGSRAFNLGNGSGHSVLEVVSAARRVTERPIPLRKGPRRAGDAARLVADSGAIRSQLLWTPKYPEIEVIVAHAWRWEIGAVRGPAARETAR